MRKSGMTRREMIAYSAGAVAGLTLTSSCATLVEPLRKKFAPRGFKLAVCDWTIGKTSDPASLEVAKGLGLDGVQVDFGRGGRDLPLFDAELQKKFLQQARKQKVEIASLALGVLNGVPYKSDPRAERWLEQGIEVCQTLAVKVVLVPFFGKADLRNDLEGTDVVVQRLKRVAPKAEEAGVYLGLESWLNAEQHMDIIDRVGSPAVKVYYDVGNSHKAGYDIYQEIRQLGRLICEFHAKDYDDILGKGSIAFPEVRRAIDDISYRGWIVIESVRLPLGLEEGIRHDGQYLRQIFPRRV